MSRPAKGRSSACPDRTAPVSPRSPRSPAASSARAPAAWISAARRPGRPPSRRRLSSPLLSGGGLVCAPVVTARQGGGVAAATPAQLGRWGGVEVGPATGTRHSEDARRDDVPRIVRELVAAGEEIYEV